MTESRVATNLGNGRMVRKRLSKRKIKGFNFGASACVFGFLAFGIVVLFFYRSPRSFARSNIITYTICRKCLGFYYESCDYGTFT